MANINITVTETAEIYTSVEIEFDETLPGAATTMAAIATAVSHMLGWGPDDEEVLDEDLVTSGRHAALPDGDGVGASFDPARIYGGE